MKKPLKKVLNLNSYQWWKNHRRFITIGLFLSLFAFYIRTPFEKEEKVRDTCAKLNSSYQIEGDEAIKRLNLDMNLIPNKINNYDSREVANHYCERYLGIK